MLLLIPALIAIAVALLQGGSLRHLATLPVRAGWLIMASFAIQLLLYTSALRSSALVLQWNSVIYIGAISLSLIGALRNWRLGLGVRIATVGILLNMTVIVFNGGHMPVNAAAMRTVEGAAKVRAIASKSFYNNTRLADRSSRLVALSDVIPVRLPGGAGNVYSLGDMFLAAGVATLAYRSTRRPFRAAEPNSAGTVPLAAPFGAN